MAKCANCGRTLKDPTSVERGYGPVCWVKVQAEFGGFYDGGDIILWRLPDGTATANVPHAIVRHSPTGFEWGYGGSGPADLALNILFVVTGSKELAFRYYQDFKWQFIATMPYEGGVIKREDIIAWLRQRGCEVA